MRNLITKLLRNPSSVIPAKAGIQNLEEKLDTCFRPILPKVPIIGCPRNEVERGRYDTFGSFCTSSVFKLIIILLIAVILAGGCGYAPVYYPKDAKKIAVPIFDNQSLWRGYEFELTDLVQNEIIAKIPNYRIVSDSKDADIVLDGTIKNMSKPVMIEGALDRTIQSQLVMTINIVVRDQHNAKVIFQGDRTETGQFVGQRFENEDSAKREVYEKLARWVANVLGNTGMP